MTWVVLPDLVAADSRAEVTDLKLPMKVEMNSMYLLMAKGSMMIYSKHKHH